MRTLILSSALLLTNPALAQQDFSATVLETLEEPESFPDVSAPRRAPPARAAASILYAGCNEVWDALGGPLRSGQPGYREDMDGDLDGIACERDNRPGRRR